MAEVTLSISIEDIVVGDGREVSRPAVSKLANSIEQIGLQHPVTVKRLGDRYKLIAGRHRLEAMKKLGRDFIMAHIVKMNADEARLWEISENLHRADLTKLQRDEQVAEWIKITDRVSVQSAPKPQGGRPEGGISAAARELGVDETDAKRAVKVASLSSEAKDAAREEGLDNNRSAMLAAAREETPDAQVTALRSYKPTPAITKADPPDMYVVARHLAAKYSSLELAQLIDHLGDILKDAA